MQLGRPVNNEVDVDLRATYDRIAPSYAARYAEIPETLLPLMQRLAQHAGGGLILDIGCGHGRDLGWFQRMGTGAIGIDLSVGMLREARRLTSAPLVQADMRRLPIRSSSVAGIWSCASLLHLSKSQAPFAISEFERTLRPGGLVFIGVQEGVHDGPRYSKNDDVTRYFADYLPEEMITILEKPRLKVLNQWTEKAGSVSWLQTLAQKAA